MTAAIWALLAAVLIVWVLSALYLINHDSGARARPRQITGEAHNQVMYRAGREVRALTRREGRALEDTRAAAWAARVAHQRPGGSQAAAAEAGLIVAGAVVRHLTGPHAAMPLPSPHPAPAPGDPHDVLSDEDEADAWVGELPAPVGASAPSSNMEAVSVEAEAAAWGGRGPSASYEQWAAEGRAPERPPGLPGDRLALHPVALQGQPPEPGAGDFPWLRSGQYAEATGAFTAADLDAYERAQAGAQRVRHG